MRNQKTRKQRRVAVQRKLGKWEKVAIEAERMGVPREEFESLTMKEIRQQGDLGLTGWRAIEAAVKARRAAP